MKTVAVLHRLGDLPEFEPDEALYTRICAAHRRRRHARHLRWLVLPAAAAAALVGAVLLLPRASTPVADNVIAWQRESQSLEQEWHALGNAGIVDAAARANVRRIDHALQAAYDRGAAADELAALWQRRSEALRGLIAHHHDALAVTQI
jgi:hypothetical protein